MTEASDGQPDQAPGKMPADLPFSKLPGNHVVIGMKGGFSAVYAHLKPGSVRVNVGDKVQAGNVIGLLGNSGASLAPHLHFHIVNGPSPITSDGYPYVIKSFGLAATGDTSVLLEALDGKAAFPDRDQMRARRAPPPVAARLYDHRFPCRTLKPHKALVQAVRLGSRAACPHPTPPAFPAKGEESKENEVRRKPPEGEIGVAERHGLGLNSTESRGVQGCAGLA